MKLKNLFTFSFFILIFFCFQQVNVAAIPRKITKTSSLAQHLVSRTLPETWSHYNSQQNVANVLGWIPTEKICFFCHGYFKEPLIISKFLQLTQVKKEHTIINTNSSSIMKAHKEIPLSEKDIVVTQTSHVVNSDKANVYWNEKTGRVNKIVLIGRVHLCEAGKLIVADKGKFTLYPKTAILKNVAYRIYSDKSDIPQFHYPFNAWGTAQYATQDISQIITLRHATYSTCDPTSPAWWISATKLVLNKQKHQGEAYNTLLWFYDFPVFYFPYYNFPIDNYRKTGFLTPRVGLSSNLNNLFSFPFYWNIAPNYDLTLIPEFMTKRGLNIRALFRFLSSRGSGDIYLSYLLNDMVFQRFLKETLSKFSNPIYANNQLYTPYINQLKNVKKNQRGFFSMNEHTIFNSELSSNIILNYVTDPYFFQDLGSLMNINPLSNQLLNRVDLQYSGLHWQFDGMFQAYQVLHLISQISVPAFEQYARIPDFSISSYYPDIAPHMDFNLNAEAINFSQQNDFTPDKPIGQRFHIRPSVSFPFYFASGYITPQILADATAYNVKHFQPDQVKIIGRLLPIFGIDSGLYFDQYFNFWGRNLTQTLETHFFYLYIPYQNQDNLPNFDTVLLPFAFEQLFALNQYIGDDRLQNANRVSFSFTSRIFDDTTGAYLLTSNLGFIYLIETQHVSLSKGCTPFNFHFSPIVGELSFYPCSHESITSSIAWDPNLHQTDNSSTEINYTNGKYKATMSYIFIHRNCQSIVKPSGVWPNILNQSINVYTTNTSTAYFSAKWPLSTRWSIAGYWNYNITHHHTDTITVDVQYNTCCWALNFITRQTYIGLTIDPVNSSKNSYDTTYFIQLELKGLYNFRNTPTTGPAGQSFHLIQY